MYKRNYLLLMDYVSFESLLFIISECPGLLQVKNTASQLLFNYKCPGLQQVWIREVLQERQLQKQQ